MMLGRRSRRRHPAAAPRTTLVVAVASVVVACSAVACGTDRTGGSATAQGAAPGPTTTTAAGGAPVPSRGCDHGPTAPVSLERRELAVAELVRWYLITVPAAPAGATPSPMPLVLDFHGLTEGAVAHAQLTGMGTFAESHGFVAVLPQGSGDLARWAVGPGGDAAAPNADLDFVAALLDRVGDDVCIDTSRVYATGISNGAMLTSLIACRFADRFAAVAPIAGATQFDGCAPSSPLPMLTIHGTADPILKFNGGVGDLEQLMSGVGGGAASAEPSTTSVPVDLDGTGYPANVRAWAERNRCDATPTDESISPAVLHRTYRCPAGADVEMYIVEGGGHAWPGSELSRSLESLLGPTTFDIDATDLVWSFFRRFRRA